MKRLAFPAPEPLGTGRQAAEGHRADGLADRRDDAGEALVLELLGIGRLLVEEVALAAAERSEHGIGAAGVDPAHLRQSRRPSGAERSAAWPGVDRRGRTSAGRRAGLLHEKAGCAARAAMKKPSRWLICAKCTIGGRHPLLEYRPARRDRRLPHMRFARHQRTDHAPVRGDAEVAALDSLLLQESPRHRSDQRAVERGVARDDDTQR